MKFWTFILVAIAVPAATAHTLFTTLFINDVNQGDGTCVRMPTPAGNATNQVLDFQDISTVCGNSPNNFTKLACPADSGAKLSFLFRATPDGSNKQSLDISHKGPCAVYMKNMPSPYLPGNGSSWFKIWDEGYNEATSTWCSSRLMKENGMISVNIPDNLAGGYYLVRTEIIALHEADKTPPNPQPYVGCAQIFLGKAKAGEGVVPKDMVEIPGYLKMDDPAVLFNVYEPKWPYPMPGPPPYTQNDSTVPTKQVLSQEVGVLPPKVLVKNANWYAMPFEPYNSNDGCWNASKSCFSQLGVCYDSAPPTGSPGCQQFENLCSRIQTDCKKDKVTGLPDLLPDKIAVIKYDVPPAAVQIQGQKYASRYGKSESGPKSTSTKHQTTLAISSMAVSSTDTASASAVSSSDTKVVSVSTSVSPTTSSAASSDAKPSSTTASTTSAPAKADASSTTSAPSAASATTAPTTPDASSSIASKSSSSQSSMIESASQASSSSTSNAPSTTAGTSTSGNPTSVAAKSSSSQSTKSESASQTSSSSAPPPPVSSTVKLPPASDSSSTQASSSAPPSTAVPSSAATSSISQAPSSSSAPPSSPTSTQSSPSTTTSATIQSSTSTVLSKAAPSPEAPSSTSAPPSSSAVLSSSSLPSSSVVTSTTSQTGNSSVVQKVLESQASSKMSTDYPLPKPSTASSESTVPPSTASKTNSPDPQSPSTSSTSTFINHILGQPFTASAISSTISVSVMTVTAQPTTTAPPTSTSSTTPPPIPSNLTVSPDGTCGIDPKTGKGNTCIGSKFGQCCNAKGKCGDGDVFCRGGCQIGPIGKCDGNLVLLGKVPKRNEDTGVMRGKGRVKRLEDRVESKGWNFGWGRRGRRRGDVV